MIQHQLMAMTQQLQQQLQLMFSNVYKGDNQQQQMLDCKILLVPFAMMES